MSKRYTSPLVMEERIKRIVKAGFDYVQFSEHHFRFEGAIDYWPSSERWRAGAAGEDGVGTNNLIAALKKRFPELAA